MPMLPLDDWVAEVNSKPRRPSLVEGMFSQSQELSLIAGRPGMGKTNLAIHLAFALATGTPFLGYKCNQVRVGYLFFEGTPENIADRIAKARKHYPNPTNGNLRLDICPHLKLTYRNLKKFKTKLEGCDVVIFDPLRNMVAGDYCKPKDAADFLTILKELADLLNFTPIICHHVRKPDKRLLVEPGDIYELKGAGDFVEVANTILMIEKERQGRNSNGRFVPADEEGRIVYFAKLREATIDFPPLHFHYNRETLSYIPVEE